MSRANKKRVWIITDRKWRGNTWVFTPAKNQPRRTGENDYISEADFLEVLAANADKAKRLVGRLARDFPREHEPCPIGSDRALDNALITAPDARDKALLKKLDALAGRILNR